MRLRLLQREDLRRAMPMAALIEAVRDAFVCLANGQAVAPQRGVLNRLDGRGTTLIMGASIEDRALVAKTVNIFPDNAPRGHRVVNGLVTVFDPDTGLPVGLCDGAELTALRTGAVAGAVTDVLVPASVDTAAVIGCGAQARTQVLALDCIRNWRTIRICGRERRHLVRFLTEVQPLCRATLEPTRQPAVAVAGAQVVTAATSAREPVLSGADLVPGCHVNGIGSFKPNMRELDLDTLRGAALFVEDRQAAAAESGELIDAVDRGETRTADWCEIGTLFLDPDAFRPALEQRSVFKSVGHAVADAAAAALALSNARADGLGREVDL